MMSGMADDASISLSTISSREDTAFACIDDGPFILKSQDADLLANSDGFNILRSHLAETYDYDICNKHSRDQQDDQSTRLLIRDILHALLVPVVELFDKAVTLAIHTTHATRVEDLEYAFAAQGRSAFLWLQCFLSNDKERDWCYTRGCPACVIEHSLDSEFSVRMLYAACLLSDVHYPFTLDGPKLPSFRFFLGPLAHALTEDPLYGDEFFERMRPKAIATRNGIEELIHQCIEIELGLSQPPTPSSAATSKHSSPVLGPLAYGAAPSDTQPSMKIKRGYVARRQMSLQIEEEQWMEEMLKRCWDQLSVTEERDVPAQIPSFDVIDKHQSQPVVTVSEIPAVS